LCRGAGAGERVDKGEPLLDMHAHGEARGQGCRARSWLPPWRSFGEQLSGGMQVEFKGSKTYLRIILEQAS